MRKKAITDFCPTAPLIPSARRHAAIQDQEVKELPRHAP
jgi:hypothetical protein